MMRNGEFKVTRLILTKHLSVSNVHMPQSTSSMSSVLVTSNHTKPPAQCKGAKSLTTTHTVMDGKV